MSCFRPRMMWRPPAEVGGRYAMTCRHAVRGSEPVPVPCGGCEGCDARRAADWCWRIQKEFEACGRVGMFVTLTLENEHLPDDFNISRSHYQGFLKRLRRHIDYVGGVGYAEGVDRLRIAGCGEYGGRKGRPHYHLLIMGWSAPDLVPDAPSKGGFPQWSSQLLIDLWKMGRVWVGEITQESIAYTVGYFRKMQRGRDAAEFYRTVEREHPLTGEVVVGQRPPFAIYSRGTKAKNGVRAGGLGMAWMVGDDGALLPDAGHVEVRRPDPVVSLRASSLMRAPTVGGGIGAVAGRLSNRQATPRAVTRKWLDSLPAERREVLVAERREAAVKRAEELEARGENRLCRVLTRELCAVLRMQGIMGVSERWPVERIREQEALIALAVKDGRLGLQDLREVHAGAFDEDLFLARLRVDAGEHDRMRASLMASASALPALEGAPKPAVPAAQFRAADDDALKAADARFAEWLTRATGRSVEA